LTKAYYSIKLINVFKQSLKVYCAYFSGKFKLLLFQSINMRKLFALLIILLILAFSFDALSRSGKLSSLLYKNSVENVTVVHEESNVIDVVKKVSPSVVTIAIKNPVTQNNTGPFSFFFNIPQPTPSSDGQTQEQYIGTGFVIKKSGIIVTNKHVVSTQTDYIVVDEKGNKYQVDKIYRDPANDIAIISVKNTPPQGLPEIALGKSSNLQVGQSVIAIGTALGEFRNTVTTGVVSGLGRGITAGSAFAGFAERLDNVIQTDAAINPGNSGGPLLNVKGQVIGINSAVSEQGQNIGFAIPIDFVKESLNNFNKTGQFARPFLGVTYNIISQRAALLNEIPQGALIQNVVPNSSADEGGIKQGNIITKIDGKQVNEADSTLAILISKKKVGDSITITVFRDGDTKDVTIKLKEAPDQ
jgi:serine protease Do